MTAQHDFEYDLPDSSIAQTPVEPRDSARLLVAVRDDEIEHRIVRDLPEYLRAGDVLVVNETKVIPARLVFTKPTGGRVEVFLLEQQSDGSWTALVRPGRKISEGAVLRAGDLLEVTVGERIEGGRRRVVLHAPLGDVPTAIARVGTTPLPPYITATLADPNRYQTVYARIPGSVAAPTAGLHLTDAVLARMAEAGVNVQRVELRVGLDTFRPLTTTHVEDHEMHSEFYRVPDETLRVCAEARARGGRVVAVGTTSVRALESAAAYGAAEGRTRLFIHGAFPFQIVDLLLTNFHQPRSTLLVLLDAFAGPRWRQLYQVAQLKGYRFLSFGDAMLIARRKNT